MIEMAMSQYTTPRPLYVKWNRMFNGTLIVVALFTESISLLYAFVLLNAMTMLTTLHYGPTRWLLWPLERFSLTQWLDVSPVYSRSYQMSESTERFEITMRIMAMLGAIVLSQYWWMGTWLIASLMGVFMMISAFFGFCLSALAYIAMMALRRRCIVC